MKERQLMKGAAFMLLAATAIPPAHAQLKTNAGVQYLLSQSKDMSQDFLDLSNTYFFADSLVSFDTSTGKGTVQWKRQQLMPRQAFNANTYLHQPLQSLDFPETAYDNNPQLTFTVEPVSERTLRIHMLTSPIVPKEDADDPMLIGKPADGRSFWKAEKTDKGTLYTSRYGSLLIENYPWRLVLKDADGRLLTQTRCWSDNDSTQVKVPPFSFIKRGSDNSRSINPVFSLAPNEKIYGCGESATALNKAGQKVNLFVTDPQGPETPDMYKPIPFFFSNRGYGMFMHTSAPVTCDFGCSYIGATKLFMADEAMDIFIFLGSPKEMLSEYTALVGRPEMPPLWSFGTWMSRITYFSEAEGRDVARKLRENKIPSDVIHFDTGWFGVDWQCDYAFAADRFDNPRQMLTDLRSQGFRTCLWQLPYFTPKNKFFPELVERGLYVRNGKGQLHSFTLHVCDGFCWIQMWHYDHIYRIFLKIFIQISGHPAVQVINRRLFHQPADQHSQMVRHSEKLWSFLYDLNISVPYDPGYSLSCKGKIIQHICLVPPGNKFLCNSPSCRIMASTCIT